MCAVVDAGEDVAEGAVKRTQWKSVGIPVLVGLLGIAIGSGMGSSGVQSELKSLRSTEKTLTQEVKQLTTENQTALVSVKEQIQAQEVLDGQVQERDAKIADLEQQLEELRGKLSDAETQLAAGAAQAAPKDEPVAFSAPATSAQAQTFYKNCAAARAAGAAPVRSGDPGYGPHLDRDGDGVGCE